MVRRGPRGMRALLACVSAGALAACSVPVVGTAEPAGTPTVQASPLSTSPPRTPSPTPSVPARPVVPPAVVVLDPGHNGGNASAAAEIGRLVPAGGFSKPCNTTGTSTDAGYAEHAFAFDVAQRAAALLRERGVTVLLTRQEDTGVGPCVDERAQLANDAAADVALSIHADGAPAAAEGFHVIEPALAPDGGNAGVLEASHLVAVHVRAAFAAATGHPPATYPGALQEPGLTRRDDLAGLNLARVPAVFVECANMRNADDAAAVSDPVWRQRAAEGIADGLVAYLTAR